MIALPLAVLVAGAATLKLLGLTWLVPATETVKGALKAGFKKGENAFSPLFEGRPVLISEDSESDLGKKLFYAGSVNDGMARFIGKEFRFTVSEGESLTEAVDIPIKTLQTMVVMTQLGVPQDTIAATTESCKHQVTPVVRMLREFDRRRVR